MAASTKLTLNTRAQMPMLGLGTWKSQPEDVVDAVCVALENGYRHIDCAPVYGNEKAIGEALSLTIGKTVKREDFFICSKLATTKHAAKDVKPACQQTLQDLGLDYLDLYLIHWPYSFANFGDAAVPRYDDGSVMYADVHFMETWVEMEKLMDEGLCKAIGVSNFNSKQISEIIRKGRIKPSNLQVECHPFLPQQKLIQFCKHRGISMTAHTPLGSRDRKWHLPRERDMLSEEKIVKIAEKHGKTPAQVMIRFQIQRGVAAVPKSVTPERIIENSKVFDFELDAYDMDDLLSFPIIRQHVPYTRDEDDNIIPRDDHRPHYPFNELF